MNPLTSTKIFPSIGPYQVVLAIQRIGFLRLEVEVYVLVRKSKLFIVLSNPGIITREAVEPEWIGASAGGVALANEFAIGNEIAVVNVGGWVPGGSVLEAGKGEVEHG